MKVRTRRIIGQDRVETALGSPPLGILPRFLGEQSTKEFRFEFFIDSTILSIANGLILAFELGRIEYGVVVLISGVVISVAGFVAAETDSNTAIPWLFFVSTILFVSEGIYFYAFGTIIDIAGIILLPRQMFFLPSGFVLTLFVLVIAYQSTRRSKRTAQPR